MDIDIERLKTDSDYWLKSDPSDGEATHFEMEYAGHECAWVRVDRKGLRHYFLDGGWVCADMTNDDIGPVEKMIPRPTKPAAPEWVDGLPPVGEEVEASFVSGSMNQCWSKGKVVAHDNGLPVIRVGGVYYGLNLDRLRPLRTKEQRERDELAEFLTDFFFDDVSETLKPEDIANAILSKYNLEPKQ